MARGKKGIIFIAAAIAIVLGILVGARLYIGYRLKNALAEKLESIRKDGYSVSYDTLLYHWRKGRVVLENIRIKKTKPDSLCKATETFEAEKVKATGLSLVTLILNRELNFTTVELEKPHVVFKQSRSYMSDTTARASKNFSLNVKEIILRSSHIEYWDSASCTLQSEIRSNVRVQNFGLSWSPENSMKVVFEEIAMDSSRIELPQKFYSLLVRKSQMNLLKGTLEIDSFKITPYYNKIAFGRKTGYETDRIEGFIPFIKLSGLKLNYQDTLLIDVSNASLQMFLKVFRDKRLPFKKINKPLPIRYLQNLAFGINIDTLQINKSYVEYEEFAEDATAAGKVFFDDLQADIYNINNDERESDGQTIMYARSNLMGEADVRIKSVFPWNNSKKCLIEGTVEGLSISKINSLMESATNVKAESGKLQKLDFRFTYSNIRSDGELELKYRDLKLITYKDEEKANKKLKGKRRSKSKEVSKEENKLKSWILNNFVIRRDVDEKDPEDERTGTIMFYRDVNRSVFNYWWKSLLSGLRSAFDLEKFNAKDNKKNRKKQKQQRAKNKSGKRNEPA